MFNEIARKQQQEEEKRVRRMVCPKCEAKMVEVGTLKIAISDNSPLNGEYCARCYRDYITQFIPKFEDHGNKMSDVPKVGDGIDNVVGADEKPDVPLVP